MPTVPLTVDQVELLLVLLQQNWDLLDREPFHCDKRMMAELALTRETMKGLEAAK